jgi:toxin YoeB
MTFAGSSTLAKRHKPAEGQPPSGQPQGPREAVFHPEFRQDLRSWIESDRRIALRVLELVEAALREPFAGLGKPEPLKHELAGAWSRRITGEHRLVYLVRGNRVEFLQARYHY